MIAKQNLQPFEFVQRVPDAGFEWVRGRGVLVDMTAAEIEAVKPEWFLREKRLPPFRGKIYRPLIAHTGLFRIFAETKPTRPGIQAFANVYGSLGFPIGEDVRLVIGPKSGSPLNSESLTKWKSEILLMHALTTLWDAIRAEDVTTLAKFIKWKDGAVLYHGPTSMGDRRIQLIASSGLNPETLRGLLPGDVIQPGRLALRQITNELLTKHRTTPRLVPDRGNGEQLCHVPESLNAALWLQFALAQASGYEFKRCTTCRKWFQVGKANDARRADATYCSNRCRQKRYRDSKETTK
jgi:hypothetical protein